MNLADLLRYARVHRGGEVLAATAVVALVSALFGGTHIALPSIGSGGITTGVPYRQQLPLLSAVFLTAALDGAMSAHDAMGAVAMHRMRAVYRTALALVVCALSFTTEALAVGPEAGAVFVRSVLIWLGLALLSVRLLGQRLSWAVPLASALLLVWYPLNWWDWTATSPVDAFSWTLAALALLTGITTIAATPWRLRGLALRTGFLRRRSASADAPRRDRSAT
ncbi:hypothetical protein [Streptomyces sp. CB01201]|uniref:hypothetical protein n=1 Tax=Streptomyces sp. CB01201 TaxID=2020324 RepID=UPI001F159BF5|nr:hypothetical protein [Streptomyces sp. CB01201]